MKIDDKFETLVEIAWDGIQWVEDLEDDGYKLGGIETVAHQIACCVCQWYNIDQGVPTCETRDYLELDKGITKEKFIALLQRYITLLQSENSNLN